MQKERVLRAWSPPGSTHSHRELRVKGLGTRPSTETLETCCLGWHLSFSTGALLLFNCLQKVFHLRRMRTVKIISSAKGPCRRQLSEASETLRPHSLHFTTLFGIRNLRGQLPGMEMRTNSCRTWNSILTALNIFL